MKVDFAKPMKNYKGGDLTDTKTGQVIHFKEIVCSTLSAIVDASEEEKIAMSILISKIWNSKGEIDITPEESVLIRKHIRSLPTTLFVQTYKLLG